jgi:hypothetical protein
VCRDVLQPSLRVTTRDTSEKAARSAEIGDSGAACPLVTGAAILILRHATVPFSPSPLGNLPSEEISNRQ